jgi:hypothetical protein
MLSNFEKDAAGVLPNGKNVGRKIPKGQQTILHGRKIWKPYHTCMKIVFKHPLI